MSDRIILNRAARNIEESPEYAPISKVRIVVGEDANGQTIVYESGDNNGRTIEIDNPWGTQEIANAVLQAIQGYAYKPYKADGAILNPVAEIGDAVSVGEVYSVIAECETTFSPIMSANIGAREDSNIDHEYPYEDSTTRYIDQAIAKTRTSLTVEMGHIAAEVAEMGNPDVAGSLADKIAKLDMKADSISASLEANYMTNGEVNASINTAISLSEGRISSTVSATYQTKTQAQADLATAKGYADQKDSALQTSIQTAYTSAINQSASEIRATVAKSVDKYDISSLPSNSGVIQAYGAVSNTAYPPASNNGKIYINLTTGEYWKSNGSKWVKQTGTAPTVTSTFNTRITQNAGSISSEVTARESADRELRSLITQTASSIRAEVTGIAASEWSQYGLDDSGRYTVGDYVTVTTSDGVTYYRCNVSHTSGTPSITKPGTGSNWQYYWTVTGTPTVQSMINMGLQGITLSFSDSNAPNTVSFTLNSGGATITGDLHVANVQADTITANALISSPVINGGVIHNASGGGLLQVGGNGIYGDLLLASYNPSNGNQWEVFRVYDGIGVVSFYGYTNPFLSVNTYGGVTAYGIAWDFRGCDEVIMPDGTVFSAS
ncbi:MAG: hypothetical protein J6Y20_01090 [Lachnospiraceae bacterium]|nr:hypothetical protein [Lachnospiraceae bacterium]